MKTKFNYSWVVALICCVIAFIYMGLGNSPLSLYIVPVTENLGFSRGAFSFVFTLVTSTTLLINLFFGFFVNRFGIRKLTIAGSIMAALAYFIFSRANTLPVFYTGAIILGASFALASVTSISILINNWFKEKQGTVLGIILAASGLGGYVFSRFVGKFMSQNGFQSSFLVSAIILTITVLPVIFFIKSSPDDQKNTLGNIHQPHGQSTKAKMSILEFIKIPGMVTGLLAVFLIGFVIHPVLVNTPAYLMEKGFDSIFASTISASIFFVLAVAKLLLGLIHDNLGIRISMILGIGSFIIAAVLLVLANTSTMVWVFVLFDGFAVATLALLVPLFAKAILGAERYSSNLGIFIAVLSGGIAVGVPVIGFVYDLINSYSWVILSFAAIGAVALFLSMLTLRTSEKSTVMTAPCEKTSVQV